MIQLNKEADLVFELLNIDEESAFALAKDIDILVARLPEGLTNTQVFREVIENIKTTNINEQLFVAYILGINEGQDNLKLIMEGK